MAKHRGERGWVVSQKGAASPVYKTRGKAQKVAKNLTGAKVKRTGDGCAVVALMFLGGLAAISAAGVEIGKAVLG